jgi:hypothetical protein
MEQWEQNIKAAKRRLFDTLKLCATQLALSIFLLWLLWYHPAWPTRVYVTVIGTNIIASVIVTGLMLKNRF